MQIKCSLVGFIIILSLFLLPVDTVYADTQHEVTVVSQMMFGPQSDYKPDNWYEENGFRYVLKSWELEPITLAPRSEHVEQEVLFEAVEEADTLPAARTILLEEEFSGLSVLDGYPVIRKKRMRERWQSGFSFPVVFHSYGAEAYRLGGQVIEPGKEKPLPEESGLALLAEIGVKPDRYRVTDTRWDGAPYLDEENIFCRNAIATGDKLVADYLVTYGGTAVFPEVEGFRCLAVYGLEEPVMEQAKDKVILSEPVWDKAIGFNWIYKYRRAVLTITAMALLALILIFVWILKAWAVRKMGKANKKTRRNHEEDSECSERK